MEEQIVATTRTNTARRLIALAATGVFAAGALIAAQISVHSQAQPEKEAVTALKQLQNGFVSVANKVGPAVVVIKAERTVRSGGVDIPDIFRGFPFGNASPSQPRTRQTAVSGSGVIVRSDGYILTNDHVAGGADDVRVTLQDGREFPGKVFRDPVTDLAVIKVEATNLPVASMADSTKVNAGDWAIAIGNPFGLNNTLTVGVVSALEREEYIPDSEISEGGRYYASLIQTDAAINPGNSGGPLLNIDGQVIGINVMIESPSGANAGIGFAIPSNTAKFVLDQLVTKGKVVRGYLGIGPADVKPVDAERYGVKDGALVQSVEDGTPAAKAGIQVTDVIVSFNGKPVKSALDLRDIAAATAPGTKVPVVIVRNKQRQTVQVTLSQRPDRAVENPAVDEGEGGALGITVRGMNQELRDQYGLDAEVKGVVVTSVERASPAARAGIAAGDVIQKVDGKPIATPGAYSSAVGGLKAGDSTVLVVRRKETTLAVDIRVPRQQPR